MAKEQESAAAKTPAKTHSQRGKYVYKPIVSTIMDCACGGKFVKTRKGQTTCVQCIKEGQ